MKKELKDEEIILCDEEIVENSEDVEESEHVIELTDFENNKNQIKAYDSQILASSNPEFEKFKTKGGFFNLGKHKVTGEEMNAFVVQVQDCFVEDNEWKRTIIKEIGKVYETFDALDKEYIQGILIAVKSAEKASAEAKAAQKDIDDTIKALQITINKLKEFKDEVKRYNHLEDIDDMWEDIEKFSHITEELSKKTKEEFQKITDNMLDNEEKMRYYGEKLELYESRNSQLKRHLNKAYIVAGGALGISIIQMILLVVGIL